ncbi:hypothetical protein BgiBS90_035497 [Biomphalaria glabrata]|uniref:Peptidase S1 domain-containing protein n=1 Tax=Biomphalaria glabrata TaxID=6526 RepID=A0A2C9KZK0_BIOGL|nr:hypothetical protein BgiBS90_035497 [Biomphalaria glabrata]
MHQQFIDATELEEKFPDEFKSDRDLISLVRHLSDLTVQIKITKDHNGILSVVNGSGFAQRVRSERGSHCPDEECSRRQESHAWMVVTVTTVYHVVKTQEDAVKAEMTLSPSSSTQSVFRGFKLLDSDKETGERDWCAVEAVTHDLDIQNTLKSTIESLEQLQNITFERYKDKEPRLVVVVGHPHGGPKKISFGFWEDRTTLKEIRSNQDWCRYAHNAATCPGSSGSPVFILGQSLCGFGYWFGHPHNHSSRSEDGAWAVTSIGSEHKK